MATVPDPFADWYRLAVHEPSPDEIKRRKKGITNLLRRPKPSFWLALVRLHVQRLELDTEEYNTVVTTFSKADPAFPTRDNEHLLGVLAGITLYRLLNGSVHSQASEEKINLACAAGLALRNTYLYGKGHCGHDVSFTEELVRHATATLSFHASRVRSVELGETPPTRLTRYTNPAADIELDDLSTSPGNWATAFQNEAQLKDMISSAKEAISTLHRIINLTVKHVEKKFDQVLAAKNDEIRALAEELNVLWWIFGEYSRRDPKEHWSRLPEAACALICAGDLADLTQSLPGLVAADALLERAVTINGKRDPADTTVIQAAKNAPEQWREPQTQRITTEISSDLIPTLRALQLAHEYADDTATAVWLQNTGLSSSPKLKANHLARQFYDECMLIRTVG